MELARRWVFTFVLVAVTAGLFVVTNLVLFISEHGSLFNYVCEPLGLGVRRSHMGLFNKSDIVNNSDIGQLEALSDHQGSTFMCDANKRYRNTNVGAEDIAGSASGGVQLIAECRNLCDSTDGCNVYVHNKYGQCFLKSQVTTIENDHSVHQTVSCKRVEAAAFNEAIFERSWSLGESDSNRCPSGSSKISSQQDCKNAAMALEQEWRHTISKPSYPTGCFLNNPDDQVFFNKHPLGAGSIGMIPICVHGVRKPSYDLDELTHASVLIIAGQGGSSTRAAWEIVHQVGTSDFGLVEKFSKDSALPRIATNFFQNTKLTADLLLITRGAVYSLPHRMNYPFKEWFDAVSDIIGMLSLGRLNPSLLRDRCASACTKKQWIHRLFLDIPQMCWNSSTSPASQRSVRFLGMKEPYLRLLLPFFSAVLQPVGVELKFIHVTRDVRQILKTHADEHFMRFISTESERRQLEDEVRNLSQVELQNQEHVLLKYAQFTYVWAAIEISLHEHWLATQPSKYFRISCPFSNPNDAHDLAQFLENPALPEASISSMASVCKPSRFDNKTLASHSRLIESIIVLPCMSRARRAMRAFSYDSRFAS